ncbi:integrase, catalytic region, zinc finger, CCHC-type containing protein [Tanacetum coccineum]|uniref:Integrase, catalytic region, zinc finger, CCHC-type containing protein n=1 Tax=Tanacetum coccineum TaxID=301880 RepID=A0ABQ4Z709_9ASTR
MFQQGEDLIECINKAKAFQSVVALRFPPSNNQLRTSSNPRNLATIQDVGPSRVVKCYNCQGEGHMVRQCTQPKRPKNTAWFKEKLISSSGTVRFGNDQVAKIMGHGDYQQVNVIISKVYYVEGLSHNLFSAAQFCDMDLEVAFRKNTFFIRNLEGVDLLSGSRDTNLYTISLDDMLKTSLICLLSKASKTKSWLWHHRLSISTSILLTT